MSLPYRRGVTNLLELLGSSLPVVAAPMSGGPTTPALVLAIARYGFTDVMLGSAAVIALAVVEGLAEDASADSAVGGVAGKNLGLGFIFIFS